MATSRLHQLAELGQSAWIDYLSRDLLRQRRARAADAEDADRRRHLEPDHLPEGDLVRGRLRRAAARAGAGRARPQGALHPARGADVGDALDLLRPVWDEGARGATATSRSRSTPGSRTTPQATIDEAQRLHDLIDRPNLFVKIPATKRGPARDRGDDRARAVDQRHADLLARALREVAEAYIRGLERLVESGGDPGRRHLGGELLRLAGGHGGGPAPGRDRRPRRAQGQARDREREARLPALQGDLRRRALGGPWPRRARRRSAASGRRRRRRTRSTGTSCTSRS